MNDTLISNGQIIDGTGAAPRRESVLVQGDIITAMRVTARKNIQSICAVPGIDLFFLGPADYSSTAGFRGQ